MNSIKTFGVVASLAVCLAFLGCSSSDDAPAAGGGGSDSDPVSETYSVTGSLNQSATTSSISALSISDLKAQMSQSKVTGFSSDVRTQCTDGFFYSVYCLSYASLTAAEGKVDCTNGGAFEVAGLPKGEAIGCFVHRLETADGAVGGDSMVGAIQIPASNLNGSTEQMVSSGDVDLAVTISANGTINASVVSGTVNETVDNGAATEFTAANMNGEWELSCNSTASGAAASASDCKCFLGDLGSAGYTDDQDGEEACLADNAAGFSGAVNLGIGLYVYGATVNNDLVVNEESNNTIPAGSTINAISIWGASGTTGSYVSGKTGGGEGASNLGGDLTWETTPDDPTATVNWASSVSPGGSAIAIGTVPADTANHAAWISWAQDIMVSAQPNYPCGRPDTAGANPEENIWCLNEVLELISNDESASLPRIYFLPYCDQTGCDASTVAAHSDDYKTANALKKARMEIRGVRFPYPNDWQAADDNDALVGEVDGIGLESEMRFVFEPLEFFPGGAGFRQSDHDERHYRCGSTQHDVQSSSCHDTNDYYELRCFVRDELSIKFLGSGNTAPINVVFDQAKTVGHGELLKHGAGQPEVVQPTGTSAIAMCKAKAGNSSSLFTATATKQ